MLSPTLTALMCICFLTAALVRKLRSKLLGQEIEIKQEERTRLTTQLPLPTTLPLWAQKASATLTARPYATAHAGPRDTTQTASVKMPVV